jgi:hypothetical protein
LLPDQPRIRSICISAFSRPIIFPHRHLDRDGDHTVTCAHL